MGAVEEWLEMRFIGSSKNCKSSMGQLKELEFILCLSGRHWMVNRNDSIPLAFHEDHHQLYAGRPAYPRQS